MNRRMLSKRKLSAYLGDLIVKVIATQGCPQGGVIYPLLWSLIVDDLLTKLYYQGFEVVGFVDDIGHCIVLILYGVLTFLGLVVYKISVRVRERIS